jgi:hypothetical protein
MTATVAALTAERYALKQAALFDSRETCEPVAPPSKPATYCLGQRPSRKGAYPEKSDDHRAASRSRRSSTAAELLGLVDNPTY